MVIYTEEKKAREETELEKTRRENLIFILNESGDFKVDMAKKIGISANRISMFISELPTQRRKINNKLARKIEEAYSKPIFWIDTPRSGKPQIEEASSNDNELEELINAVFYGVKIARAEIKRQLEQRPLSSDEKKKLLLASIQGNLRGHGRITEEQFSAIVSSLL